MSKKVVVLGGGISGYGSAILAKKLGFETFLSDSGKIAPKFEQKLQEWEVEYEQGGHSVERILVADLVIKSPGIPEKAPLIMQLRQKGVQIVSEIEFAGAHLDGAKTICITGSNGKTTTTTLTYKILKDAGFNVALGGNIGESFAYSVATAKYDWYVLEVSSFQLDDTLTFGADVAVLMNITPDHLDRYNYEFQNYIDSKMRITRNMSAQGCFIYSADDPVIAEQLPKLSLQMKQLPFSVKGDATTESGGALVEGRKLCVKLNGKCVELDTAKMRIKGLHNHYNSMAAALAALGAGVSEESIKHTIENFGGVEHRLERVAEVDGVTYINDSKATNVDSVWYALESMKTPTVWIAGGTDKGNDYAPLVAFARSKVKALVCMGVDNSKLIKAFEGVVPQVISTSSLDEAMRASKELAVKGDTVLLSPACASFDLFKNYQDRGDQFKQWVLAHKGSL